MQLQLLCPGLHCWSPRGASSYSTSRWRDEAVCSRALGGPSAGCPDTVRSACYTRLQLPHIIPSPPLRLNASGGFRGANHVIRKITWWGIVGQVAGRELRATKVGRSIFTGLMVINVTER